VTGLVLLGGALPTAVDARLAERGREDSVITPVGDAAGLSGRAAITCIEGVAFKKGKMRMRLPGFAAPRVAVHCIQLDAYGFILRPLPHSYDGLPATNVSYVSRRTPEGSKPTTPSTNLAGSRVDIIMWGVA
jgi:hypothetical protein